MIFQGYENLRCYVTGLAPFGEADSYGYVAFAIYENHDYVFVSDKSLYYFDTEAYRVCRTSLGSSLYKSMCDEVCK